MPQEAKTQNENRPTVCLTCYEKGKCLSVIKGVSVRLSRLGKHINEEFYIIDEHFSFVST